MKIITDFCRSFVGYLFIFSGLIKANDPLGFSYKLGEYFEKFQQEFSFAAGLFELMHDVALPLAMFLVVLEIVLGVAVITGYLIRITSWLLLLLILFFTALTFVSAQFQWVTSCGCFGDAIPLTPWESFIKDIILLTLILVVFVRQRHIEPNKIDLPQYVFFAISLLAMIGLSNMLNWFTPFIFPLIITILYIVLHKLYNAKSALIATMFSLLASGWFTVQAYNHLPFKDFRAYAVGKNIPEQTKGIPDKLKYYYRLKEKSTGKITEFEKFPENYEANYEYVDFRTEVIEKGVEPKIHDFVLKGADGAEYTEDVLSNPDVQFLIVAYDLSKTNEDVQPAIKIFAENAGKKNLIVNGLTSSSPAEVASLQNKFGQSFTYYFADAVTLKTIIRSNPGLVMLKNGTVLGQWHYNDFPTLEEALSKVK